MTAWKDKQTGQVAELVDAYPNYIEMVELNYLDIPLTGSNPVLIT